MPAPPRSPSRAPRLVVAGFFAFPMYEEALCAGLQRAGARVTPLRLLTGLGVLDRLRRWQSRHLVGPAIVAANARLLATCLWGGADALFAWQQIPWLLPGTVRLLRRAGVRVGIYSNDDPFGAQAWPERFPLYGRTVREVDVAFAYRPVNLEELRRLGARRVELLRSAFDPLLHRPVPIGEEDRRRFGCDLVFIGHCEADQRLAAMDALFESGLTVKIFGTGWEQHARGHRWAGLSIERLEGEEYVRALCAARIGLVFLSGRNRDQYTRRCFEIPATGTLMLAPRTAELQSLFREGEEAAFFSGTDELLSQARRFLADPELRARVAAAGRARVLADGHDIDSRAARVLEQLLGD